ncbi:hypothetical protein N7481_012101 [Penicillium waksmanii]|uniref:uncharacterized protein n=1 Tax=Penicillium waksmanii TaxID=69791 RepID=UPI002548FB21|nr:uncharacterized protein N7481_012101 [Penicillium waksmanii]KAJ5965387.1 hypothetical protein N7481_012101 [Penicillium waksmanii]
MRSLSFFGVLALIPTVISSPVAGFKLATRGDDRGNETVSGLGVRKQEVTGAGGNTRDLAIAMLETKAMTSDYIYGDGKSGDATNFGIFKQNWYILRHSASAFLGETADQVDDGAVLNSDLDKDIEARHDGEDKYGFDVWFAGHRNGASGVENPDTSDIQGYKDAVLWIQEQIESNEKYQSDDTRFWVNVQAI